MVPRLEPKSPLSPSGWNDDLLSVTWNTTGERAGCPQEAGGEGGSERYALGLVWGGGDSWQVELAEDCLFLGIFPPGTPLMI